MATDWKKFIKETQQQSAGSGSNEWKNFVAQEKTKANYNNTLKQIKDLTGLEADLETQQSSFERNWNDVQNTNQVYAKAIQYFSKMQSVSNELKRDASGYKKLMGDKAYNDLLKSFDEVLKNQDVDLKAIMERGKFYTTFKTADEYNTAVKNQGYAEKYKNRTYQQISDFIKSDDYNTMRRRGLIDESEAQWLRNQKYALGTSTQLQKELDSIEDLLKKAESIKKTKGSVTVSNMGNEFNPQKSIMPGKSDVAKANENFENQIKALGYKNVEQFNNDIENKKTTADILKTVIAQKKQIESFNQKWGGIKVEENYQPKINENETDSYYIAINQITPKALKSKTIKKHSKSALINDRIVTNSDYFAEMEPEEKNKYNKIYETKGITTANQYADDLISLALDKRLNEKVMQKNYDFTSKNGFNAVVGSIASVGESLGSGIEYVTNLLKGETDRRVLSATRAQGLREGTKSHWDSDVWDFVYDTTMSGIDSASGMALSVAVPYLGEALLGGSAAAHTFNNALDRGVPQGDAVLSSLAAGVAESLFEHVSIGTVLKGGKITAGWTKKGLLQATKKTLVDMGVNFSEETLTEISNVITDRLINGELSNYDISVRDYYMQGMSPEDAKRKAAEDIGTQIGMAGLSGMLMGFGFGTIGSTYGLTKSQMLNSKAGSNVVKNGEVEALKTLAKDSGIAEIQKAAEKIDKNSKPSKIGYVFNSLLEEYSKNSTQQLTTALLENGATERGSNSAKGWAAQILKNVVSPSNKEAIKQEIALRVNKLTGDVYANFVDNGKYGGDALLNLLEIGEDAPTGIGTQSEVKTGNTVINDQGVEVPVAADGEGAAVVTEAYKQGVAENLEKQRPNPKTAKAEAETKGKTEEEIYFEEYFAKEKQITPEEEQILKDFAKENGLKVEFTDKAVDGKAYGSYADGTIVISRYAKKPMRALFKHEFSHSVENAKGYAKFQEYVLEKSNAFKQWLNLKGYGKWSELSDKITETYKKDKVKYNNAYAAAKADIVADFVGDVLFGEVIDAKGNPVKLDTNFLVELKKNDRNLFQRFVEWVHSILKRLTTKGVVNKDIVKLEQKFKRLAEQARQQRAKGESEKSEEKQGQYMFASEGAKTADKSLLEKAKDMLYNKNASKEKVWEETGWKLGKDNKWRFEIDDSKMEFDRNGFITNPDVLRRNELFNKIFVDGIFTKEELQENAALNNNLKGVKTQPEILSDFIKHDELFAAYPELKNIKVEFKNNLDYGANGSYNYNTDTIELDATRSDEAIKETLVHEIQHAVQNIEGLAEGGNQKLAKMLGLLGAYSAVKDTAEYKKFTTPETRLEFVEKHLETKFKGDPESRVTYSVYKNLYGETEARRSSERIDMNEEDRKNSFPENDGIVAFHRKDVNKYKTMLNEMGFSKYEVDNLVGVNFDERGKENDLPSTDGRGKVRRSSEVFGGIRESSGGRKEENRRTTNRITQTQTDSLDGSVYSLPESDAQYSLPEIDNEGNKLSEGQRRFFDKSKLTDEQGNLLRLYHGSRNGGFTKFSAKYSDDGITLFLTPSRELAGTYTDSMDTIKLPEGKKGLARMFETGTDKGKGQSGIYEVYANAKKPYILDCDGASWNKLPFTEKIKGKTNVDTENTFDYKNNVLKTKVTLDGKVYEKTFDLKHIVEKVEKIQDGYHSKGFNKEKLYKYEFADQAAIEVRDYYKTFANEEIADDLTSTATLCMELLDGITRTTKKVIDNKTGEIEQLNTRYVSKWAKENGYDAVWFKNVRDTGAVNNNVNTDFIADVVVVFDGSQIKSVDNLNPTKNKDIRYSLPDIPDVAKGMESANVAEETSSIDLAPLPEDAMKTPTNRELISNALESIDTSTQAGQDEIKLLNKYLDTIDYIKEQEAQLSEVQKKLFPKGGVNPDSISVSDVEKQIKSGKKEIHGYEIDHIYEGKHGVYLASYTLKTPYNKRGNDYQTGYDMDVYRAIAEHIVEQYRKDAANFPHYAKTIARIINENKRYLMQLEEMKPIKDILARGKSNTKRRVLVDEREITVDETLAEAINKYGTMPKGERPKVDVNVPEKVSKTKNVNQFMRNVLESGHLDADMTEREKRNIISGARTYNPISDKAALDRAEKKIKADVNGAVQEWENAINGDRRITKYEIALGEQLLVQAAETGNANDVTRYVAELAELGTQLGQDIQALRLLKQMTGMGQLYYVTRAVARLNKDIESRYGEKHKIVEIDPNLANILANAKSEAEIDDVVKDLIKDVASQVESSWVDKFNSWRYLAMLGNPRTHFRNIVGNAVFMPAVGTKNKIAAIMETMFVDKENRTKTFGFLKPEYRDFATEDFKKVEEIIKGGGKMNPADQIRDQMKVYNSKAFAWLEGVRQFNFNALETEDGWFLKGHYIRAFGGAMQARGLDVNNIKPAQLEELRTYAIKEAQKATYRDASHFAQTLNKLAHPGKDASLLSKATGVAVEGLLPFKKTPINILKRGIEYSPIGIATSIADAVIAAKKGQYSGTQFIDGLSSGLTGTGIMLLGAFFWSIGWISGGMDYDDEDALERLAGKQPYALKVGDYTFTIDFAAPAVLPFMVGAETAKILNGKGNDDAIGFFDAIAAMGAPMTELSMLQGLNDAIETIAYSDNKMGDFATNIFASYFSQYIPTIGGQIARTFDSTRRTNFVDKNSPFPKIIQTTYQKALGKIPGAENTKVPYIDAWGRTEENDNFLLRAFENFVSPGYISKVTDDSVNNELAKIYTDTGESGVIPKRASTSFEVSGERVNLNADEYVQYATDKGQYSRKYLEEIMSSDLYNGLSSDGKAEAIAFLFSYANAKAKSNVSDYDYREISTYKTAAKLEDAGISPASYAVAKFAMSNENADTDGSGSVTKSEKQKALRDAGFSSRDANKILNINKK